MTIEKLFFKRTIKLLDLLNYNAIVNQINLKIFDLTDSFFKSIFDQKKYSLIICVYFYEFNTYSYYIKQSFTKERIFKERSNKINKVNSIAKIGFHEFLKEDYVFNKKTTFVKTEVNIDASISLSEIEKICSTNKEVYSIFIKPTLRYDNFIDEILILPNTLDYILVNLWEHDEYFSGNDVLEALGEIIDTSNKTFNLKDIICDKLIQYLVLYDAIDIKS
jgi:hypothetical protein